MAKLPIMPTKLFANRTNACAYVVCAPVVCLCSLVGADRVFRLGFSTDSSSLRDAISYLCRLRRVGFPVRVGWADGLAGTSRLFVEPRP